ncbi:MAG: nitroreductase family protein [Oscillospiraceae bacterium]|nr:nitroreductase family protein [Oscillospiraceae bacterium]
MDIIFNRRSVRKYTEQKIEPEKIDRMLRAAMQAPSAGNQQPWEFIVIDDKETLVKLADFSRYAKMLPGAALGIVVLERQTLKYPPLVEQDLGACVQNLMLQATEDGLGTVWLGISRGDEREAFVAEMFNLPESVRPYGVVSIGYPEDENANHFVDRYDETRVHYNKY